MANTPSPLQVLLAHEFVAESLNWDALIRALRPASQARLAAMTAPRRRQEFVLGRALAVQLLNETVGPEAWDLLPIASGKPVAVGDSGRTHAALSISHSRGQVLCAIALTGDLGCDIEVPRGRSDASWRRLANFDLQHPVFAPDERRWILEGDSALRDERLFALWTIKEAIGKASGRGLRGRLSDLAVDVATVSAVLTERTSQAARVAQGRTDSVVRDLHNHVVWHWQLLRAEGALVSVAADQPLALRWR